MLWSIQLNNKQSLMAKEINNIASNGFLSLKVNRVFSQKTIPQPTFFPGHFSAQIFCTRYHFPVILKGHLITSSPV